MLATPDNSLLTFWKVVGTWLSLPPSPSRNLLLLIIINSHIFSLSYKYVILLLQMNHVLVLVLHQLSVIAQVIGSIANYIIFHYYETLSTDLQNIHAGELTTSEGSTMCK